MWPICLIFFGLAVQVILSAWQSISFLRKTMRWKPKTVRDIQDLVGKTDKKDEELEESKCPIDESEDNQELQSDASEDTIIGAVEPLNSDITRTLCTPVKATKFIPPEIEPHVGQIQRSERISALDDCGLFAISNVGHECLGSCTLCEPHPTTWSIESCPCTKCSRWRAKAMPEPERVKDLDVKARRGQSPFLGHVSHLKNVKSGKWMVERCFCGNYRFDCNCMCGCNCEAKSMGTMDPKVCYDLI